MTPERYTKLNQVLDCRQPDLTLLTDQVHKPRNIAALIRNCDAVGIQQMHAVTPAVSHRPFNGTARGSQQWVDLIMHDSVENGVISLQHQGFKVVAAHWSSRSINYTDWDYTQPTALLLGAERMGVSTRGADLADAHVIVPMVGMVASLNVSVAAGIILQEAQRQRAVKGMYEYCRLEELERSRIFFRWAYPRIAEVCDQNGQAYPLLDDIGNLIEPWTHG
ncbi:hypothetical protein WH50_03935 [Pokkaliibacter plantistimulans]|uniref:tRNA (guanosine(18)-2'-O)-methyltransferase n=1 Tax=Pokkaliibacter plantistimulans TaxID=1635171 RepID=A0ABX5M4L3_9GAMM|nr:tRNA (guanosine(18)-2'-O)-methyltransferase TrmH [Pokkaliibacter plantistimulans]PXF32556.1 hypothetical protein WH50_03935 [Pokkaliibacter plantistimulans]